MKRGLFLSVLLGLIFLYAGKSYAGKILNDQLPDWVEMDVEFRYRYEHNDNADFNDSIDDDKGFSLGRTRVGITLLPIEDVKLFYQFQDARIWQDSKTSTAAFEDWADTRQLWAQFFTERLAWEKIGLTKAGMKVGRQEFSYGGQRLIGAFNWSNIGQSFDAVKVMMEFEPKHLTLDAFGGGKTPIKTPREKNDFYDGAEHDDFFGYYATYKGKPDMTVDQYLFIRNTDGKTVSFGQSQDGEVEDYTLGGRIKGKIPDTKFDYEIEAAKQFGNSGSLDVDAQMAVAILGYTFDHSWKPRVAFEFDYGSGDDDPADGKRETFDNLFPTNHLFYGYMDFVSLQNLNNYQFQVSAKPMEKLGLQADWHMVYLDNENDDLYAAGRTIKRSTVADADRHVGNEIDLKATYKICTYADMLVGYSHFFAGSFLKDTGSSDDSDFYYIQTVFAF